MPPLRPNPTSKALVQPSPRASVTIRPFKISRLHAHEGAEAAPAPEQQQQPQQQQQQAEEARPPAQAAMQQNESAASKSKNQGGSSFKSFVQENFVQPGKMLEQRAGRKIYPGANERSLSYLTGALPGDFGWDPLHLADSQDQDRQYNAMSMTWLQYAEVIHCRWAMLGAAGAIAPELLGKAGIIPESTGLTWFEAGGLDSSKNLIAVPFTSDIPFQYWTDKYTLLFTMHAAMGFAEFRRWQEYKEPGSVQRQWFLGLENYTPSSGAQPAYPGGGFFNFAGFGKEGEDKMFELKTKEIRNGRLAMLAFLGFMVQAEATHKGPVQNLIDHVSNPISDNILARFGGN